MTDKQIAADVLGRLPETASLDEIADELQVLAAIQAGRADLEAGRVKSHAEMRDIFSSWTERWKTTSHASS